MPVDRTYAAENDAQRERLRALVRSLGDQDLARPMEAGWTVAAVLAHAAFWDQRIVVLLDHWEQRGPSWTPPLEVERDGDWINDAAKALCLALPPRVAADLAVSVAEAVDRRVAALSDAIIEANARAGSRSTGAARSTARAPGRDRASAPRRLIPRCASPRPPGETAESELHVDDPPVVSRNATPSVFHQRHIGRVLRSSCNARGRRLASSRGREPRPGRCPPLWPGDLRNDGGSVSAAGADGSEA